MDNHPSCRQHVYDMIDRERERQITANPNWAHGRKVSAPGEILSISHMLDEARRAWVSRGDDESTFATRAKMLIAVAAAVRCFENYGVHSPGANAATLEGHVMSRANVYSVIDATISQQVFDPHEVITVENSLLSMRVHCRRAMEDCADGHRSAYEQLRELVATAVLCFEAHGAPMPAVPTNENMGILAQLMGCT